MAEKKVWTEEEICELWPQANRELRGFQRALEARSGITAMQLSMALHLAEETFQRLGTYPRYHLVVDGQDQWFDRNTVGSAKEIG